MRRDQTTLGCAHSTRSVFSLRVIATVCCILVAACSQPTPTNAAGQDTFESGLYASTYTVLEMSMTGAPSPELDLQPRRLPDHCLDISNLGQIQYPEAGVTCTLSTRKVSGGSIEAEGTCSSSSGSSVRRLTGSYSSNRYQAELVETSEAPGIGRAVIRARFEGERIGSCTSTQ